MLTKREAFIAHLRHHFRTHRGGSLADVRLVGAWVSDPLDVTQIVYSHSRFGETEGVLRHEPVDDVTALVPDIPPHVIDPDTDLDPANRQLFWMAYNRVWDVIEPNDSRDAVMYRGITWFGDVTESERIEILPESCRIDLD